MSVRDICVCLSMDRVAGLGRVLALMARARVCGVAVLLLAQGWVMD